MALLPGSRLGPYEVVGPLGAGGMGEVYRARDTRLDRTVALKIVNPAWSDTDEGRWRFEREARVVSQISHPHVCALYDVGRAGDRDFLVMEFVEGETLAARLARGPLPLGEVLRLGQALARGLDAAHRRGVVHRDFKPGNVLLAKHGPKILDFGLASALAADAPIDAVETRAFATSRGGAILGTLPYMAPEQMQGRPVDARADVFALGAVLYEMTTGERAFDAPSQAGVIAAVIGAEPPPAAARRAGLPASLDRLIGQCLAKDPDERPQTAGEVARALMLVGDSAPQHAVAPAPPRTWRERVAWLALAAGLAALVVASRLPSATVSPPARTLIRFELPLPQGTFPVVVDVATTVAIAPDGRHVVFPLATGEVTQLWLHAFDTMQTRPVRGTEGARGPFWSPGSGHVGFFAGGAIKRVSIESGAVDQICAVSTVVALGSWGAEDTILFVDSESDTVMRVSARGGTPERVLSVAGKGVTWPHFLPDGRRFLVGSPSGIFLGALDARELTPVLDVPTTAAYAPSGHLLYVRESVLVTQPFSVATGRVEGEPRVLAEGLQYFAPTAGASFSVSDTGVVVYRRGDIVPRRLIWIGRDGRELGEAAPEAPWTFSPRISPDERHLAVAQQISSSGSTDLWVYELPTGTPTRLTADVQVDNWPAWWPDGRSLVFSRNMEHLPPSVARKALTDVAPPVRLLPQTDGIQYHADVAPDGRVVAFGQEGDIWVWRVGDPAPEPLVQTPFGEGAPAFSPDGRWFAYDSNVSGRTEVYIRPFGRAGDPARVSTAGGFAPRWRGDGREVFFLDLEGRIMGAVVTPGASLAASPPARLAATDEFIEGFDVSRDGQRFVALLRPTRSTPSSLSVIVDR